MPESETGVNSFDSPTNADIPEAASTESGFISDSPDTGTDTQPTPDASLNSEGDADASDSAEAAKPGPIPYERFKEVNDQVAALRGFQPLIEQLQAQGITSYDQVQDYLQQQQEQQDAEARASQQYDPELDPENYQQAVQYQVANARLYRIEMNSAFSEAQQKFPQGDVELARAIAQRPEDVQAVMAHSHARVEALTKQAAERAVADYIRSQKEQQDRPTPEGRGGEGPSLTPKNDDWMNKPLSSFLGRNRRSA